MARSRTHSDGECSSSPTPSPFTKEGCAATTRGRSGRNKRSRGHGPTTNPSTQRHSSFSPAKKRGGEHTRPTTKTKKRTPPRSSSSSTPEKKRGGEHTRPTTKTKKRTQPRSSSSSTPERKRSVATQTWPSSCSTSTQTITSSTSSTFFHASYPIRRGYSGGGRGRVRRNPGTPPRRLPPPDESMPFSRRGRRSE